MLSNAVRQPEINPIVQFNSDKVDSNKLIEDLETGHTNSISFTDEAWKKIINEEVDLNAVYRRAKYLFNRGIKLVEFDVEELEKWGKKSAFGKLSKYANPKLIPLEENAWESAVIEKYGKSSN